MKIPTKGGKPKCFNHIPRTKSLQGYMKDSAAGFGHPAFEFPASELMSLGLTSGSGSEVPICD